MTTADLVNRRCKPCEKDDLPLSREQAEELLAGLHPDWHMSEDSKSITRDCKFSNYHETIAFVNGLAWIAHCEDHHPDLEVGYNRCAVHFSTHAINGLSDNDFICAAKIDALLRAGD